MHANTATMTSTVSRQGGLYLEAGETVTGELADEMVGLGLATVDDVDPVAAAEERLAAATAELKAAKAARTRRGQNDPEPDTKE